MPTPTLTSTGLTMPRAADFLVTVQDSYEAATGLSVDWDRDQVVGVFSAIIAEQLDEVGQAVQAVYDARSRANATGVQLSDLGVIVGVDRDPATYSTATVTLTGTAGVVVVQGSVVEGGGDNDDARWEVSEDATIAGLGTDVVVTAVDPGAIVATATQIDKIVTPITGWTGVSNLAAATVGTDEESDSTYRARQQSSLRITGSASAEAIRAKLAALDYVEAAVVVENDDSVAAIVDGILMDPNSIAVIILPNTLTTAQKEAVVELIYTHCPAGVETIGTQSGTVTKADSTTKTIYYSWATADAIVVDFTIVLETGYTLADVDTDLEDAAESFPLAVGQDVTLLDMLGLAAAIVDENTGRKKIRTVSALTIDAVAADYVVAASAKAVITGSVHT